MGSLRGGPTNLNIALTNSVQKTLEDSSGNSHLTSTCCTLDHLVKISNQPVSLCTFHPSQELLIVARCPLLLTAYRAEGDYARGL